MNKKGQIYLVAALLLGLVIYGLVSEKNFLRRFSIEDDFEELSENYQKASSTFINHLVKKSLITELNLDEIEEQYIYFTTSFSSYSKTQNSDFGLIYLFDYEVGGNRNFFIGNYLDQEIFISIVPIQNIDSNTQASDIMYLEGCKSQVSATIGFDDFSIGSEIDLMDFQNCTGRFDTTPFGDQTIYILIGDVVYEATLTSGSPEIIIVSQEFKNNQRKVFLDEEFVTGEWIDLQEEFCNIVITGPDNDPIESPICDCTLRNEASCTATAGIRCIWNQQFNNNAGRCELDQSEPLRQ